MVRRAFWMVLSGLPMAFAVAWNSSPNSQSSPPTYAKDIVPIFRAACISCHSSSNPQGSLDLSSEAGINRGGASGKLFDLKNPKSSLLLKRLTGKEGLPTMPLGFAPLTAKQIQTIETWVASGAKIASTNLTFDNILLPIVKASCLPCHSKETKSGGLDLTSEQGIRAGGNSGPAFVPGNPEQSQIIRRIEGQDGKPTMPMGFKALPADQIQQLRNWISEGASFDKGAVKQHWAYVAPVRPTVPNLDAESKKWVRNLVDSFILKKLQASTLSPSPEADRPTLIRRLYIDLIGLPPSPSEVDAFLADKRHDAYERIVDRLLASKHYGEQRAIKWLDLARYADSNGYEKDGARTMWKYRDWVIDAFNRNMPYDQFTVDQLAGDMLPQATMEQLVASGFHRNTMHNLEGGVDQDEAMYHVIVDRVNTTSTVWLGQTVACAQCHDHKYDPTTHEDYFRMYAVFANNEWVERGPANVSEMKYYEPEIRALSTKQVREIAALNEKRQVLAGSLSELQPSNSKVAELKAQDAAIAKQIAAIESQAPTALVMRDRKRSGPLKAWLRTRGEFLSKAREVESGTPHFLPNEQSGGSTDRLALAKWIVDRSNPLTARVQVNRMWEEVFGRGIVETSENFGTQGSPPSHPELLDWLATEFVRLNWDMKAIMRLIVTSSTYRQSSRATHELLKKDPENRLLARAPRYRLAAENIRDVALASSGLLSRQVGGPSVFPPQPEGIWNTPYSGERWTKSKGEAGFRRGLYTFLKRTSPYPNYLAFDASSREVCTVRRSRTNTPLQSLALLNDPAFIQAAKALAQRSWSEGGNTDVDRLKYAFRLATSRKPDSAELKRTLELLKSMRQRYTASPTLSKSLGGTPERAAWTMVCNVFLNLDETISRN